MNKLSKVNKRSDLFSRISDILTQARKSVVRNIDNTMVIAYWHIGREIVQELQHGGNRASYGEELVEQLSKQLTARFGRGFSTTNIRYFRTFYLTYADRKPEIRHFRSGEFDHGKIRHLQSGVLKDMTLAVSTIDEERCFSPVLGWTHYRTLMQVENPNERLFYEIEAEKECWDVELLKHQIHTFLFARLLKSKDKAKVLSLVRDGNVMTEPSDAIKNPYILDFLGIPESTAFLETELEAAIIANIQSFLLELGKGFAFVGRQKRMQFDDKYFNIDLVFYNCILKCYLLIDLKIGELTHQDVGQMDSYVRMFDDKYLTTGDNPTIGLILCAKGNDTIAKYSVLKESKHIFASKYMLYLPSEKELSIELKREQKLVAAKLTKPVPRKKPAGTIKKAGKKP